MLDDAVQAGATQVNGIGFDVADRAAAEAKARESAVKDAKAKADTLANGLGVNIQGVASISESVSTPPWYGPVYGGRRRVRATRPPRRRSSRARPTSRSRCRSCS